MDDLSVAARRPLLPNGLGDIEGCGRGFWAPQEPAVSHGCGAMPHPFRPAVPGAG